MSTYIKEYKYNNVLTKRYKDNNIFESVNFSADISIRTVTICNLDIVSQE